MSPLKKKENHTVGKIKYLGKANFLIVYKLRKESEELVYIPK